MEYRSQEDGVGTPMAPSGYNPSSIRTSAFSRPTLSPSSSLILSPRGGLGGGARNGNCFEAAAAPATTSSTATSANVLATPIPLFSRGIDPHPAVGTPSIAVVSSAAGGDAAAGTDLKEPSSTSSVPAAKSSVTTTTTVTTTRYRECLRNHAASMGGHVVDGCGEFMAGGEAGTSESLKCAACGCHRSFHRRESDSPPGVGGSSYYRFVDGGNSRVPLLLPPPPPGHQSHHQHSHHKQQQIHAPGTFPPSSPSGVVPGSSATESSSEELNAGTAAAMAPSTASKKRFRTKFTADQKEKMLGFAERVGWKLQRQDDAAVERFCSEVGVRRQVLKVWMHNNKHTARRQQHHQQSPEQHHQQHQQHQQHQHQEHP